MKPRNTNNTVLWQLLIGLALLMSSGSALLAKSSPTDGNYYTAQDKEFYLTADEIFFIRPGLEIEVISVEVPSDMQLEVTYSLKDPGGLPLDIDGVYTPGAVDMRYMLTYIPQGEEQKVILTSGTRDSDGVLTALGDGMYTYKFGTVLGDSYDPDATHVLGLVGRRDLQEYELDRYVDNVVYNFVPSGSSEPVGRDVVTTETCNGRCHDPLALHGGRYQEIGICTQCHNPTHPSGPVYSMDVMIHKVHDGQAFDGHDFTGIHYPIPINDCEACHTGGTPTKAFPLVANPNPAPVCDYSGRGITTLSWDYMNAFEIHLNAADGPVFAAQTGAGSKATGKWVKDDTSFYLVDKASGDTVQTLRVRPTVFGCAGDTAPSPLTGFVGPGTFRGVAGEQHTNWLDHPSRAVCGSCHDDVDFETGEGHLGGAMPDDSVCNICHVPDTGNEFDRSVRGAHTLEYKSKQLPGLLVQILDVTNTGPGARPTVKFTVGTRNGRLDPASLNRLRFAVTGPNEDFSFYAQETVGSNAVQVGETHMWTYTFNTPLPADAAGSYTASFEARNDAEYTGNNGALVETEDQAQDSTFAFAVTDATAVPRRHVVNDYNCEACHRNLSLHGDNRNNPQYCVTCHQPDATDAVVRPPAALPPQSIHFKYMVHKIHAGAELQNGYVVYGYGGSLHEEFVDVEYPGDLRNCAKCHVNDSYELPLPEGVLATTTPQELWTPTEAITATCIGCHDGDSTIAHMDANTSFFGESCSTCHGAGKDFAVEKVHAR